MTKIKECDKLGTDKSCEISSDHDCVDTSNLLSIDIKEKRNKVTTEGSPDISSHNTYSDTSDVPQKIVIHGPITVNGLINHDVAISLIPIANTFSDSTSRSSSDTCEKVKDGDLHRLNKCLMLPNNDSNVPHVTFRKQLHLMELLMANVSKLLKNQICMYCDKQMNDIFSCSNFGCFELFCESCIDKKRCPSCGDENCVKRDLLCNNILHDFLQSIHQDHTDENVCKYFFLRKFLIFRLEQMEDDTLVHCSELIDNLSCNEWLKLKVCIDKFNICIIHLDNSITNAVDTLMNYGQLTYGESTPPHPWLLHSSSSSLSKDIPDFKISFYTLDTNEDFEACIEEFERSTSTSITRVQNPLASGVGLISSAISYMLGWCETQGKICDWLFPTDIEDLFNIVSEQLLEGNNEDTNMQYYMNSGYKMLPSKNNFNERNKDKSEGVPENLLKTNFRMTKAQYINNFLVILKNRAVRDSLIHHFIQNMTEFGSCANNNVFPSSNLIPCATLNMMIKMEIGIRPAIHRTITAFKIKEDELRESLGIDLLAHDAYANEAKFLIGDVLTLKTTFDSDFSSFVKCTDDPLRKHLPFGQFLHHFCLSRKYLERYLEFFNSLYQRVEVKINDLYSMLNKCITMLKNLMSKVFDVIWLQILNKKSEADGRQKENPLAVAKITIAYLLPILIIDYLENFTGYYKDLEMVVNSFSVSLNDFKGKFDVHGLYPFLSLLINACEVGVLKDGSTYSNIVDVFIPVTNVDSTHALKDSFYYLFRICTLTSIDQSDMKQLSKTICDATIMPNLQHFLCNFVEHVLKCTSISTKKANAYAPKNSFYPRLSANARQQYRKKKDVKTLIPVTNVKKRVPVKRLSRFAKLGEKKIEDAIKVAPRSPKPRVTNSPGETNKPRGTRKSDVDNICDSSVDHGDQIANDIGKSDDDTLLSEVIKHKLNNKSRGTSKADEDNMQDSNPDYGDLKANNQNISDDDTLLSKTVTQGNASNHHSQKGATVDGKISPSTSLPQIGVGTRLSVLWPKDKIHYPATVTEKNTTTLGDSIFTVRYEDDGSIEVLNLEKEIFTVLGSDGVGGDDDDNCGVGDVDDDDDSKGRKYGANDASSTQSKTVESNKDDMHDPNVHHDNPNTDDESNGSDLFDVNILEATVESNEDNMHDSNVHGDNPNTDHNSNEHAPIDEEILDATDESNQEDMHDSNVHHGDPNADGNSNEPAPIDADTLEAAAESNKDDRHDSNVHHGDPKAGCSNEASLLDIIQVDIMKSATPRMEILRAEGEQLLCKDQISILKECEQFLHNLNLLCKEHPITSIKVSHYQINKINFDLGVHSNRISELPQNRHVHAAIAIATHRLTFDYKPHLEDYPISDGNLIAIYCEATKRAHEPSLYNGEIGTLLMQHLINAYALIYLHYSTTGDNDSCLYSLRGTVAILMYAYLRSYILQYKAPTSTPAHSELDNGKIPAFSLAQCDDNIEGLIRHFRSVETVPDKAPLLITSRCILSYALQYDKFVQDNVNMEYSKCFKNVSLLYCILFYYLF